MSQSNFNPHETEEYYGGYKLGFFGSSEQIFVTLSAQYVSARGFTYDKDSGKYVIAEISYEMKDIADVEQGQFDNKPCSVIRTSGWQNDIYLPGLNVMPSIVKNSFSKFKERSAQLEAERLKKEVDINSKSSENLTLEEEIEEFKNKVNKLKIMKENGVLSPDEFQEMKDKLMDLYS